MSDICVTNNSGLPIHVAMSWKGVVQDYVNYLQPGDSHQFDRFYRGRFDFTAVVATKDNSFAQNSDVMSASGLVKIGSELTKTIEGLVVIPSMGGLAEIASSPLKTSIPITASGPTTMLDTVHVEGAEGVLLPTHVKALFVADSYRICVRGGEIVGRFDAPNNTFSMREINPIRVYWKNKTRDLSGTETGVSVYSCGFD